MPFGSSKRFDRIETQLRAVYDQLQHITEVIDKMATNPPITQAQFTADLGQLQTTLTQFLTDFSDEVAALKAANPAVDFSGLDATVQTLISNVSAADATTGQEPTGTASADAAKK